MAMPDLKDLQNEWDVKEVQDKQQIKDVIYYLVKWADWPFKYNFYKSAGHLIEALKAVANYKHKLKHKQKKNRVTSKTVDINKVLEYKNLLVSHKHS